MGFIGILLLVIFVLVAVLLIVIVMMQDDQGEGIGGLFGGGSTSAFGSRSGNILTKTTGILGALFLIGAFGLAWMNRTAVQQGDVIGAARREANQETSEWWNEAATAPEAQENSTESE
jgi:preprotein translocase subunit SecG